MRRSTIMAAPSRMLADHSLPKSARRRQRLRVETSINSKYCHSAYFVSSSHNWEDGRMRERALSAVLDDARFERVEAEFEAFIGPNAHRFLPTLDRIRRRGGRLRWLLPGWCWPA